MFHLAFYNFYDVDTLWSEAEHGARNDKPKKDAPEPEKHKGNLDIYIIHTRTSQAYTQKLATENVPHTPYDSSGARPEITPGSMLTATEKLTDVSLFEGSKVLIVKADKTNGFQGLIINRLLIWDIMEPIEEGLDPLKDAPLSYGGFLMAPKLPLVALTRVRDKHPEVLPGVYFLDPLATLNLRQNLESHDWPVTAYWFFFGYSRWGWNQLFDEIADGSWNLFNGTVEKLDWPVKM
ncbi:uncharacterized protein LOC143535143 [Bidens hawaiensis]|uniref:uncharacterized protein LOC143535143 n=1 Tax=Bidens hawaiensis TaxID=980011 RepID=UPI00404B4E9A